eukprot:RCo031764
MLLLQGDGSEGTEQGVLRSEFFSKPCASACRFFACLSISLIMFVSSSVQCLLQVMCVSVGGDGARVWLLTPLSIRCAGLLRGFVPNRMCHSVALFGLCPQSFKKKRSEELGDGNK